MNVEHKPSLFLPLDTLRTKLRVDRDAAQALAEQNAIKVRAIELLDKLPLKIRAEFTSDLADAYVECYERQIGAPEEK